MPLSYLYWERPCQGLPTNTLGSQKCSFAWFCCEQSTLFSLLGLRSPTMVCQRVTKAVIHILTTEGYLADVYIDDFYGVDLPELAGVAFNRMTELFEELGLEASPAKDQHKCLCLKFGSIQMTWLYRFQSFNYGNWQLNFLIGLNWSKPANINCKSSLVNWVMCAVACALDGPLCRVCWMNCAVVIRVGALFLCHKSLNLTCSGGYIFYTNTIVSQW